MRQSECGYLGALTQYHRVLEQSECIRPSSNDDGKRAVKLAGLANIHAVKLKAEGLRRRARILQTSTTDGFSGFDRTVTRESFGITSLRSSSRFPLGSRVIDDMPVMLPPGRARLAASPAWRGSPEVSITIGIVRVAF